MLSGTIVRLTTFGAFVELTEGVEGLCHVSEFDSKRIEDPENHFKAGQELDFKIIKLNLLERKIGLSVRLLQEKEETMDKEPSWSYKPEVATTSIGDIAGKELDELKKKAEQADESAEEKGSQDDEG